MAHLSISSTVTLHTGTMMPLFGLGTWMASGSALKRAVQYALEIGYRLIDTASAYGNEEGVAAGIAVSPTPRQDVFITSKVATSEMGYDETLAACRRSLARLHTDYLNLYLIHWPAAGWQDSWRALLKLQEEGRCRDIGVSNFDIHHLQEVRTISPVTPTVNQVKFSPFLYQKPLLDYCREHGIALEGYSPLTRGTRLDDPALRAIAAKYGKSPVQILIRWPLQHGVITIPKSANPDHIRENAEVFDFELSEEDMATLDGLSG